MEEEKIVLDKKSFGALAVDSRVNILKALRERRKTLTELSDELKLSVSSTKEHLDKITDAGLAKKVEEGHKWKYYELTRKGERLVSPDTEVRVWVLLGISFIAFIFSMMFIAGPSSMTVSQETEKASPFIATGNSQDIADRGINTSVPTAAYSGELQNVSNSGSNASVLSLSENNSDASMPTSQNMSGALNALGNTGILGSLPPALAAISGIAVFVCFAWLVKRRIWF